jgi:serine/threonine-protein kinase
LNPRYPARLEAIVMRALDRNPEQRYQTALEVEQDLTNYLYEERILVSHAAVAQLLHRVIGPRIDKRRDVIQKIIQAVDGLLQMGQVGPHQLAALADLSPMTSDPFNITLTNAAGPSSLGIAARLESHTIALPMASSSSRPPAAAAPVEQRNTAWLWVSLLGVALIAGAVGLYVTMFRNRPSPIQFLSMQTPGTEARKLDSTGTGTSPSDPNALRPRNDAPNADNLPVATEPGNVGAVGAGRKSAKDNGNAENSADEAKEPEKPADEAKEPEKPADESDKAAATDNAEAPAKEEPEEKPAVVELGINKSAANAALASAAAAARGCRSRGESPTGNGRAAVTFSNDGSVAAVSLSQQFNGTAIGQCVAAQFRQARAPSFSGDSVTLFYPFDIPQ